MMFYIFPADTKSFSTDLHTVFIVPVQLLRIVFVYYVSLLVFFVKYMQLWQGCQIGNDEISSFPTSRFFYLLLLSFFFYF